MGRQCPRCWSVDQWRRAGQKRRVGRIRAGRARLCEVTKVDGLGLDVDLRVRLLELRRHGVELRLRPRHQHHRAAAARQLKRDGLADAVGRARHDRPLAILGEILRRAKEPLVEDVEEGDELLGEEERAGDPNESGEHAEGGPRRRRTAPRRKPMRLLCEKKLCATRGWATTTPHSSP